MEAGDAIASIIFLDPRTKNEKWSYEFILITYSGLLKSYHVSLSNGFSFNYEFSFCNFYKNGVNAVAYDEKHSLFYVAGNAITKKLTVSLNYKKLFMHEMFVKFHLFYLSLQHQRLD